MTEAFKSKFGPEIIGVTSRSDTRITVNIKPSALLMVGEFLFKTEGYRFIIASALHSKEGFEIYYHFSKDETGLILNIHVTLDHQKPEVESLSNMFEAANWIEREMHELFGIDFLNHPNQEKLLSEGNWAEGVYPYRKNFNNIPKNKR